MAPNRSPELHSNFKIISQFWAQQKKTIEKLIWSKSDKVIDIILGFFWDRMGEPNCRYKKKKKLSQYGCLVVLDLI